MCCLKCDFFFLWFSCFLHSVLVQNTSCKSMNTLMIHWYIWTVTTLILGCSTKLLVLTIWWSLKQRKPVSLSPLRFSFLTYSVPAFASGLSLLAEPGCLHALASLTLLYTLQLLFTRVAAARLCLFLLQLSIFTSTDSLNVMHLCPIVM